MGKIGENSRLEKWQSCGGEKKQENSRWRARKKLVGKRGGQKICIVDEETDFENTNSQGTREICVGDSVQVVATYFRWIQPAEKDNWLYYASSVKFLESDMN